MKTDRKRKRSGRKRGSSLTPAVDGVRTNITPATANPATFEENVQFILSHCDEPLFPRTISTFATGGRQIDVGSFEEMVAMYEQGDYLDCRVNAYNSVDALHAPNLLFIDIDRWEFKSDRAHLIALRKTLDRIKYYLDGHPTVIWSGNGYQIIQPLDAYALEQDPRFANLDNHTTTAAVSVSFLRFAEKFLSGGKSDQNHNPSFKSCDGAKLCYTESDKFLRKSSF